MKKTSAFIVLFIVFIAISCTTVYASSSATYFDGKSPIIEDPTNAIQILSNEITINTDTSKINNEFILKNTSNEEITTTIKLPLENAELSLSINNLAIVVNGTQVEYTKENGGEYVFRTKIPAGTGKKVEFSYYTDNNLRDAKVIKYNLDNFKGKKIGKLKVDIILNEMDIPLVKKIYPGHYTYDQNVITVEYYDMDINVITKDVIVTKETYKNLKYGREYELTEYDKKLLDDIDNLFSGEAFKPYSNKELIDILGLYFNFKEGEYYYSNVSEPCRAIYDYVTYKEAINRQEYRYMMFYAEDLPLLREIKKAYLDEIEIIKALDYGTTLKEGDIKNLVDKKICIEFVETIDNKDLYVNKNLSDDFTNANYELVKVSEREVLKTKYGNFSEVSSLGARIIFLNEGIDGEKLDATNEEKISYLNSINADLYIRVELYEGKIITYEDNPQDNDFALGKVGYYRNSDSELALAFSHYEIIGYEFSEEKYNRAIVKLTNEYIENNCEVPTVVQFLGYVYLEDGRNVVAYFNEIGFYESIYRGIATAYNTIQTEEAQRQLKINKSNNEAKRTQVLKNLKAVTYVQNEETVQKELLEQKKQEEQQAQANKNVKNNIIDSSIVAENKVSEMNFEMKDIIIFSAIGLAIVICIAILIIENKKRKKGLF